MSIDQKNVDNFLWSVAKISHEGYKKTVAKKIF